ncbi:MAG: FtsQ-type POTRA domain-containing protein [Limnochordales bacterium]
MLKHPERVRVGAALLALLAVIGLYAFFQSPFFAITEVRVVGAARLAPETLIERAQVRLGDNVLHVDLQAVASRLASHPRIQHAAVVRQLPGVLEITVTEYEPVALVLDDDGPVGLAADGTRVPLVVDEGDGLPALLDVPPELVPVALEAAALVPAPLRSGVAAVGFAPATGLWLATRSGTQILLGDGQDLERKLAIALELLADDYTLIDVRFPRRPVVRSQ